MLNIAFGGHKPSKFKVNPIVKAFIISEIFFWSGANVIGPILAIYVANEVSGGSIEAAGTAVTAYLVARLFADTWDGIF